MSLHSQRSDKENLKKLFEEYIGECIYIQMLRPETIRGYREIFRNFCVVMPELLNTQDLNRDILTAFFQRIQVRKRIVGRNTEKIGIKNSTVRTYWSKLNSFFEWLRVKELVLANPLTTIKPPEVLYTDKREITRDEAQKIISSIALYSITSFIKKRDLAIVSLLLFCGLRRNELISLQIPDVDMEKRIVTVNGATSKSKKTRQIPMSPILHNNLLEYLGERKAKKYKTQYLIVSSREDRGLTAHGLKHWVWRIQDTSGVKFHLHKFRHTFACSLARQNIGAIKLQKLMGHTDLRMTQQYLRSLSVEDYREDINRINLETLT